VTLCYCFIISRKGCDFIKNLIFLVDNLKRIENILCEGKTCPSSTMKIYTIHKRLSVKVTNIRNNLRNGSFADTEE